MSNHTTNYNLVKPLQTESYNVDVQNGNMDIIDANLKSLAAQSLEKASLYIAETLPAIADRKEKTMYLKITDIVNANTSNNLKVSPTMGLKIV